MGMIGRGVNGDGGGVLVGVRGGFPASSAGHRADANFVPEEIVQIRAHQPKTNPDQNGPKKT